MATASSEAATEAAEQSAATSSIGGAASSSADNPSSNGVAVAELLSADEELQHDWEVFGKPELYEAPTEQELRDIDSSRHRSRGERARRKRLQRNRKLIERMRNAEAPLPSYLLDRESEAGSSSSAPLQSTEQEQELTESSGNEGGEDPEVHERRFERWLRNPVAQAMADKMEPHGYLEEAADCCAQCGQVDCSGSCGIDNPLARPDGGSADCYYLGPDDHERLEQQQREAREQSRGTNEDYLNGFERDCERTHDDAGRRSLFYGLPAGDLLDHTAAPLGWEPPNFIELQRKAREVERERWVRAVKAGIPPPRREDYDLGEEGREAFRAARRDWYQQVTSDSLEGVSIAEQHRLCHDFARRFRAYNDGRPPPPPPPSHSQPPSPPPPPPPAPPLTAPLPQPQRSKYVPKWKLDLQSMSDEELAAKLQQQRDELQKAQAELPAVKRAALMCFDVMGGPEISQHNELKQCIDRLEIDTFRMVEELRSRDDDNVVIDTAPPDDADR